MPFALLIIGALLLTASVRNTQSQLYSLVKGDLTGQNNFVFWIVSLLVIGAVGYIPKLRPISIGFLTLVIVALFITKGNPGAIGGGFFSQFTSALNSTTTAASPSLTSTIPTPQSAVAFPSNAPMSGQPNQSTINFPQVIQ